MASPPTHWSSQTPTHTFAVLHWMRCNSGASSQRGLGERLLRQLQFRNFISQEHKDDPGTTPGPKGFGSLLRLLQLSDDGIESGLWFAFAIEQQRIIYAPPGESVQPALAVVQIPERDAHNDIGILAKQPKELCILIGLSLQNFWRT